MNIRSIGWKGWSMTASAVISMMFLSSCTPPSPANSSPSDQTLRVGLQKPTSLLPWNASGLFADVVIGSLFDGLVDFNPETGAPQNLIAETIETEDQATWRITLKEGWTFHNGEPVDAASFARAWNAGADPDNAWVQSNQFSNIEGYDLVAPKTGAPTSESLSGIVVEETHKLTVKLKEPNSQFPYLLGMSYYLPMPAAALNDLEAYAAAPIGNGPYRIKSPWVGGDQIETTRYDNYGGEKAKNAGVTFKIYTGNDVAYTDYQAGEVDIVSLNASDVPEAKATYGDLVRSVAKDDWRNYLSLPTYLPGYDKPEIRRALSMAVDRESIINSLLHGNARIAQDFDIPTSVGYRNEACGAACSYNPDAAKALWDAAGGIEGELVITSVTGTGREVWAEAIAQQWSKIFGVKVRIDQVASENTWPSIKSKKLQTPVALGAPANYPSPIDTLRPSYRSTGTVNGSFYNNPAFDALLDEAARSGDPNSQLAYYDKAKDLLIADMPSILLWTYASTYVVSEQASAYKPDSYNKGAFSQIELTLP